MQLAMNAPPLRVGSNTEKRTAIRQLSEELKYTNFPLMRACRGVP
jgi:hypothetical protein